MTYAPPLRDIRFTLEEVVAIEQLKAEDAFEDLSPDTLAAVLEEAGKLADAELEQAVAVIPGEAFGPSTRAFVRIGLAQSRTVLKRACKRLRDFCES